MKRRFGNPPRETFCYPFTLPNTMRCASFIQPSPKSDLAAGAGIDRFLQAVVEIEADSMAVLGILVAALDAASRE